MMIGVDEAGRGPVIGPLVICSAAFEDNDDLIEAGVKDSKMINMKKREELFNELTEKGSWTAVIIPASSIDSARETMTLNQLEVLGFSSAISTLLSGKTMSHPQLPSGVKVKTNLEGKKTGPVTVDAADVDEARFGRNITESIREIGIEFQVQIVSKHKADRDDPTVGAASIIAKVIRDRIIKEIENEIGTEIGSGYPSDPKTKRFLFEWLKTNGDLPPHCRRSWETSKKLLDSTGQTTLLSF
jgi:ribonuclease HII